jgi:hypothetical protein
VWVSVCVCVCLCVCVDFVMCGCFGNMSGFYKMCVCVVCVDFVMCGCLCVCMC